MPQPKTALIVNELPRPLRAMVAPMVRWAFGVAIGTICAAFLGLFVVYDWIVPGGGGAIGVSLIGHNYLPGYDSTPLGAVAGIAWGLVLGFVTGWTLALVRNTMLSLLIHVIAWRQRLAADANVLDDL